MCAAMADVVVLPCVPAKQSALLLSVMMPRASERFIMRKPPVRKNVIMADSAGTAGVNTTSVPSGLRKGGGMAAGSSS